MRSRLTALTRVLFLYFIQSKGWLNGDTPLCAPTLSDRALSRAGHFHRSFSTHSARCAESACRSARRRRAIALGRFPFSTRRPVRAPTALETPLRYRRLGNGDCGAPRFRRSLRAIPLLRPRARCRRPRRPDMRGRVFEGVMEPEERRSSRSYYISASLVREIVRRIGGGARQCRSD